MGLAQQTSESLNHYPIHSVYDKEKQAYAGSTRFGLINWKNKVLTMNEGLQLKQASIKKNVLKNIHTALWEEKTITAKYTSKNKTFPSKYNIHPAGIVYRGRLCYLICSFEENNEKISNNWSCIHRTFIFMCFKKEIRGLGGQLGTYAK